MTTLLKILRDRHMSAALRDGSINYAGRHALVPRTRIPNRSLLSAELQHQVRKRVTS